MTDTVLTSELTGDVTETVITDLSSLRVCGLTVEQIKKLKKYYEMHTGKDAKDL